MASVNMKTGLKMVGDRASGVAGAAAAIAGMSVDNNTNVFTNNDTNCAAGGASPNFQGNGLDSTPTGTAATTPYVVTHLMTLTAGQFNTFIIKRIALHNTATPTDAGITLMFGIDGFSITKNVTYASLITYQLSYT